MIDIQTLPRLTRSGEKHYEKYKAIKEEISRVNARLAELKKAKQDIDEILVHQFEESCPYRRLSGGKILERKIVDVKPLICTPEMVGTVIREGYSYADYKEQDG